jgi:hypothetical protein
MQWVPGDLSPGMKRPEDEAHHSPPNSVEVNNTWSYTSVPHMSSWRSASLVKHWERIQYFSEHLTNFCWTIYVGLYIYKIKYLKINFAFAPEKNNIDSERALANLVCTWWRLFCHLLGNSNSQPYWLLIKSGIHKLINGLFHLSHNISIDSANTPYKISTNYHLNIPLSKLT